ncbi:hypothetical protein ACFST9_20240 [Hymenobacter monticola]|uniref:Uncharacterized protein n=1 Tax=Hymenobacter monticola TaxID=1705399 RepID=A0ABY4B5W7_9BACT|nr:hypothetical protein [Hymenobacter monticola]UOE34567.1 hypothetical protein MTP16_02675 [Hymenobacter monticola]
MSTSIFLLFLFLVLVGPPVVILVLGLRFYKLSQMADLMGRARQMRLVSLAALASGLTGSFYLLVIVVSAKLPGAHGPSRSSFPWLHEHPLISVLLAALGVTLMLVAQPAKRPAGLSFGAGALAVLIGLGIYRVSTGY